MSVRVATSQDVPAILGIYGPYVSQTAISFEYDVPTEAAFGKRFQRVTRQFPWFVWEEEGKVLGYAYADAPFERSAYGWCAEPSVYLAPEARRRGIGKALYEALEAALVKQGYCLLYAIITTDNHDSVAFHKALGYRHLADFPACGFKHGAWHGVTWMEKRLQDLKDPAQKPMPFCEVVNSRQK